MRAGVMDPVLPAGDDLELFQLARELGFDGVEVVLSRSRPSRLADLLAARATTRLAVPSLVLGEHSDLGGITDPDLRVAHAARRDVELALTWALELGADILLLPFFGRAELRDHDDVTRAAAAFRPLCAAAEELGVVLCYEGTLPADRIEELARLVGSPAFGCYFDLANVVVRGLDTATEIRALGPLVRRVHFKDALVTTGDCRPGEGRVDFAASSRALDQIGYDGWIVLETPPGAAAEVARDLAFARSALPRLTGR